MTPIPGPRCSHPAYTRAKAGRPWRRCWGRYWAWKTAYVADAPYPIRSLVGFAAVGLVLVSCGKMIPGLSSATSPSPTAVSSTTATPPTSNTLQANDCTSAAPGTARVIPNGGADRVGIEIPAGWSQIDPGPTETIMARFQGPSSYADQPTLIDVLSWPTGPQGGESAASFLQRYVLYGLTPKPAVLTCGAGGDEAAAFAHYVQGNNETYIIVLNHKDFAYGARLTGTGGIDTHAMGDFKSLLGSWSWPS